MSVVKFVYSQSRIPNAAGSLVIDKRARLL